MKGRGDPAVTTERLDGLVVRSAGTAACAEVGDIVLDDTFFDREEFGSRLGAGVRATRPGRRAWARSRSTTTRWPSTSRRRSASAPRARIELEPDARDYFVVDNRVVTVRANGRRKLRPHTVSRRRAHPNRGGRARPLARRDGGRCLRRVGDPAFYYGQTLRMLLRQRGIRVSAR